MTDLQSHISSNDSGSVGEKQRWTGDRIARLGYLMGLGWSGGRVAEDPIIRTTPSNVYRQAQRFGLAFRTIANSSCLPPDARAYYQAAAAKRGLTREALIRLLLLEIASDPNLLDNILDD